MAELTAARTSIFRDIPDGASYTEECGRVQRQIDEMADDLDGCVTVRYVWFAAKQKGAVKITGSEEDLFKVLMAI